MRTLALIVLFTCNHFYLNAQLLSWQNINHSKLYVKAIQVFLENAYRDSTKLPDSLFVSVLEETDHATLKAFDDQLIINNVPVKLANPQLNEALANRVNAKKPFINLIGWTSKKGAEFIVICFDFGMRHSFDSFFCFENNNEKIQLSSDGYKLEKYNYDKSGNLNKIEVFQNGKFLNNKVIPHRK